MSIQMRRGNEADLDKTKLVSGEIAVSLDESKVRVSKGDGETIDLATQDDLQNIIKLNGSVSIEENTLVISPEEETTEEQGTPVDIESISIDGGMTDNPIKDTTARADIATINGKLGANNGIATLNSSGKVPESQLPSYVDDVVEGYLYNGVFYEDAQHTTPITGESGKIYVDLDTDKSYRWGGSMYVLIGSAGDSDNETGFYETVGYKTVNYIEKPYDITETTVGGVTFSVRENGVIRISGSSSGSLVSVKLSSETYTKAGYYFYLGLEEIDSNTNRYSTVRLRLKQGITEVTASLGQTGMRYYGQADPFEVYLDIKCNMQSGDYVDVYPMALDYYTIWNLLEEKSSSISALTSRVFAIENIIPSEASSSNKLVSKSEAEQIGTTSADSVAEEAIGWDSKNKIPMTLSRLKEINTDGTWSDNEYTYNYVTYTVYTDAEGYVTKISTDGTSPASSGSIFYLDKGTYETIPYEISKRYKISGLPEGATENSFYYVKGIGETDSIITSSDGLITFASELSSTQYYVAIGVANGYSVEMDNKDFYPMIRDEKNTDTTFKPYHSTVKEELAKNKLTYTYSDGRITLNSVAVGS